MIKKGSLRRRGGENKAGFWVGNGLVMFDFSFPAGSRTLRRLGMNYWGRSWRRDPAPAGWRGELQTEFWPAQGWEQHTRESRHEGDCSSLHNRCLLCLQAQWSRSSVLPAGKGTTGLPPRHGPFHGTHTHCHARGRKLALHWESHSHFHQGSERTAQM